MTDCFLFTYSSQKNQVWVHDRDTFLTLFSCFVLCGNAIKSWKNSRKTWYLHKNHEILEKKKKSQTFETLWTIGDPLTVKNQLFGNVQKNIFPFLVVDQIDKKFKDDQVQNVLHFFQEVKKKYNISMCSIMQESIVKSMCSNVSVTNRVTLLRRMSSRRTTFSFLP